MQVGLWTEQARIHMDPDSYNVNDSEVSEPEEAICKLVDLEATEGRNCPSAMVKGRKRTATVEASAAKKVRGSISEHSSSGMPGTLPKTESPLHMYMHWRAGLVSPVVICPS